MNYYQAGDNYGRMGNYPYRAGGVFNLLGKAVKGIAGLLPGPIGTVARAVTSGINGGRPKIPFPAPGVGIQLRGPFGTGVAAGKFGPGPDPFSVDPKTGMVYTEYPGFRRRRINPMNVKALRRASRRIDGFVKTSRTALKHTQYILVRRGSGRGRGGSPGRITRSEAARALRS